MINTEEELLKPKGTPECEGEEACFLKEEFLESTIEDLSRAEMEELITGLEAERDALVAPIDRKIRDFYMKLYCKEFMEKMAKVAIYGK